MVARTQPPGAPVVGQIRGHWVPDRRRWAGGLPWGLEGFRLAEIGIGSSSARWGRIPDGLGAESSGGARSRWGLVAGPQRIKPVAIRRLVGDTPLGWLVLACRVGWRL